MLLATYVTTTCYLLLTTHYQDLVHSLVREEWWWPWGELPRSLKLAAANLGYDQYGWQTEEFKHSGQRFYDWEEVEIEREVEIARGGGVVVEDGAGSACSDSELISGHDAYGRGGCCSGHDGQSRLGGCNVQLNQTV